MSTGKKLTSVEFKTKVLARFPDQDLDLSETVFVDRQTYVEIVCRKHGRFRVKPVSILSKHGCGCPDCAKEIRRKIEEDKFIAMVKEKFGDKYGCEEVYYESNRTPVKLICHVKDENGIEHGAFMVLPSSLKNEGSCGCDKCSTAALFRERQGDVIRRIREKHKDKKISFEKFVFKGMDVKSTVTCHEIGRDGKEHGDFEMTPHLLLNGAGCRQCFLDNRTKTKEQFIADAEAVHGVGRYDYSIVDYENGHTHVWVICHETDEEGNEHGPFRILPSNLLHGSGCKQCNESGLERKVRLSLRQMGVEYDRWKYFSWLSKQSLDFYLPEYNIAIECQGIQHYKAVDFAGKGVEWAEQRFRLQQDLDQRKKKLCDEHGLSLYYIRYDDNVEEILTRILEDAKNNASCQ